MAAHPPAPSEKQIVDHIKSKTRPKAKAAPLDYERAFHMDQRDPRAQSSQWPCVGHHVPMNPQGNLHGAWRHGAVCNVRMEYIPRRGSPGQTTKTDNPGMVKRMLSQLRDMLGDSLKPTSAICLAMQQKVNADEKLDHLIREHRLSQSVAAPAPRPSTATATATATAGYLTTATPTRRSSTPPRDSPDRSSNESWQAEVSDCRGAT